MNNISIDEIESVATQAGFNKIGINFSSRVISFRTEDCRINVYYTTGTVATSLYHPIAGKTQLFRRNVSTAELKQIFQNPRMHSGKGCSHHSPAPRKRPREENVFFSTWEDEETALKGHIKDLYEQIGICSSQLNELSKSKERESQKERLQKAQLDQEENARRVVETKQKKEAAAEAERIRVATLVEGRKSRGMHFSYFFPNNCGFPTSMKNIACVAIGGGGYVAVFDNGGMSYSGVPPDVRYWLEQQKGSKNYEYIHIGCNSQWLGQKKNGKPTFFCTNEACKKSIQNSPSPIKFCAFGDNDDYFVRYKDGYSKWSLSPDSCLSEILRQGSTVDYIWLGRKGAYFVVYDGRRVSHRGLSDNYAMNDYLSSTRYDLKQVLIDDSGNWFVRYIDL